MDTDAIGWSFITVALVLAGSAFAWHRTRRVSEHHVEIVERLGRYHRTARPRWYLLRPWEQAHTRVDLRELTHVAPPVPFVTADNARVSTAVVIRYRVVDPVRTTYEVRDPVYALRQLAVTLLRDHLDEVDLSTAQERRTDVASRVRDEVRGYSPRWGIEVIGLEIRAFEPMTEGGA